MRDLTNRQWEILHPFLSPQKPKVGRPNEDHRIIVNGSLWIDRTGAPWRDLPERYGCWSTVASRFYRCWREVGIWQRILSPLHQQADVVEQLNWNVHYVDSSVIRLTTPRRSNEHSRGKFDRAIYRERNRVERTINRLKQFRRVTPRY